MAYQPNEQIIIVIFQTFNSLPSLSFLTISLMNIELRWMFTQKHQSSMYYVYKLLQINFFLRETKHSCLAFAYISLRSGCVWFRNVSRRERDRTVPLSPSVWWRIYTNAQNRELNRFKTIWELSGWWCIERASNSIHVRWLASWGQWMDELEELMSD